MPPLLYVYGQGGNNNRSPEANHQTVVVGGERVDGVPLDHVAPFGALQLTKVSEAFGDFHPLLSAEAVPEHVFLVLQERETFGAFLNLDLRALFVLLYDEPVLP